MALNQSTWWVKYSDYEIYKDENGTEYVRPTEQAVMLAYDVMANPGKSIEALIAIALEDEKTRTKSFAKRFGLLGTALEDEIELEVTGEHMVGKTFGCTGRPKEYEALFAKSYQEKTARISAWLDWIVVLFNRNYTSRLGGRFNDESFVNISLQTMLESACKKMLAERMLHICKICKKVYYNEDMNSLCCGEKCQLLYDDLQQFEALKARFQANKKESI